MAEIRKYAAHDKGRVIDLLRLNTPIYFHPSEEEDFITYLEQDSRYYFVVEDGNRLIGSGGFNLGFGNGKAVRISWDLINPDFQGKGIGKMLTLYRIRELRKVAAIEEVEVRTSQLVYPFYEKMGFHLQRVEKDYWAPGFDLYQMNLHLQQREE